MKMWRYWQPFKDDPWVLSEVHDEDEAAREAALFPGSIYFFEE